MIRTAVAVVASVTVAVWLAAVAAWSAATYAARVIGDDDFDLWENDQ